MNIFDEIQDRLSSKVKMRSLFKDTHTSDLEKVINRMQAILEEKIEAKQRAEEERSEKTTKIAEIKALMAEQGLSLSDFGSIEEPKPRKKRNTKKFLFRYENEAGDTIEWIGSTVGRTPTSFNEYLKRTGKQRSDCIIKEI